MTSVSLLVRKTWPGRPSWESAPVVVDLALKITHAAVLVVGGCCPVESRDREAPGPSPRPAPVQLPSSARDGAGVSFSGRRAALLRESLKKSEPSGPHRDEKFATQMAGLSRGATALRRRRAGTPAAGARARKRLE